MEKIDQREKEQPVKNMLIFLAIYLSCMAGLSVGSYFIFEGLESLEVMDNPWKGE